MQGGHKNQNNQPRHLKILLCKTKEDPFWSQPALPALQRESGLQNEILPLVVDEHLSPLTSVSKTPPAIFAGISLFSLPFWGGILVNDMPRYVSVCGWQYCEHGVLYMSCRVLFHLKTTGESTVSCSCHSAVQVSPCRETIKSLPTRGSVWPEMTAN